MIRYRFQYFQVTLRHRFIISIISSHHSYSIISSHKIAWMFPKNGFWDLSFNRSCQGFEACGTRNQSSPCWVGCFFTAVLGPQSCLGGRFRNGNGLGKCVLKKKSCREMDVSMYIYTCIYWYVYKYLYTYIHISIYIHIIW